MTRLPACAALVAATLLAGCNRDRPADAPAAAEPEAAAPAPAWPDARTKRVAEASGAAGATLALELRHSPAGGERGPEVSLVLVGGSGESVLWKAAVDSAVRDAAWNASWRLSPDPAGGRLALSWDGGTTFRIAFERGGRWVLCPHESVAGQGGQADWAKAPGVDRWAAAVLETAVWGCDGAGGHCRSRSLAAMPVHHSEPGDAVLWRAHEDEVRDALAVSQQVALTRPLAVALVDAAVGYQRGMDEGQLKELGEAAARAFAAESPLSTEERRALSLRVVMAREELKKSTGAQASPRVSIEALSAAMEQKPVPLGR